MDYKLSQSNLIFLGLSIISFIIYNRVFRERLPRVLFEDLTIPLVIFYGIFMLTFFIMLLIILYSYLNKNKELYNKIKEENKILTKIFKHPYNLLSIVMESLKVLDTFIKNNSPRYDDVCSWIDYILVVIGRFFYKYRIFSINILYIIKIFTEIIVCLTFLVDIFYFQTFNYFYKSLILLIIPMVINYIIYSMSLLVEVNLKALNDILELRLIPFENSPTILIPELNQIISLEQWRNILKSEFKDKVICYNSLKKDFSRGLLEKESSSILNYTVNFLHTLYNLSDVLENYKTLCLKYDFKLNIFKYSVYFCGWSYVFFKCITILL